MRRYLVRYRPAATLLFTVFIAAGLAGCGGNDAPDDLRQAVSDPMAAAKAASLSPSDPDLKTLYDQTCRNCHTNANSGAPLTGDTAAWEPRMAQGMDTLLDHTINGYRGMPPLGSCMDCNEEDFEALIRFMATGS